MKKVNVEYSEDIKNKLMQSVYTKEEAFKRLISIVKLLRKECPWDREQSHTTLKTCLIEEAYEMYDAIDKEDIKNLKEECGDVLLQVIFHGVLAEESEEFTFTELINEECEKMIRRHPHIFNKENSKTVDKVLEKWENIKRGEYAYESYTQELKAVPSAFPALTRSFKVQKKASEVGFDWESAEGAFDKIKEETDELIEAYRNKRADDIYEELGDLLFSVVNVSRFIKVNPEEALRNSAEKFINRFEKVENEVTLMGKDMKQMSLRELDEIWEKIKSE